MQDTLEKLASFAAVNTDLATIGKFMLMIAVSVFVIVTLARLFFGRESKLNHAVCGAIGILFVYAASIVIYTFKPGSLANFLSPLPFVAFSGESLYLFVFEGTQLSVVCAQVLSMVILSYLFHFIDDFLPRGKGIYWLVYRVLTIVMAMALHYVVAWAMRTFLPGALYTYAPTVLVVVLVAFFFLGLLKFLLGLVLTVVNPIIGAVYAFFFSNKLGTQLTRAVLTTFLLTALVYALSQLGYAVISVSEAALTSYAPLALALLALWYIIGRVL